LTDLEHAGIFQNRLDRGERVALGDLIGRDLALEQAAFAAVAAVTMRKRHVAGLVRRHREREAAQLRLHRIETVSLDIERDNTDIARAVDESAQGFKCAHGLVFGAVKFLFMGSIKPRCGERLRRERTVGLALRVPSPLEGKG